MVALLERHGARLDPVSVGALGLTDLAAGLLTEAAGGQALLWGAIRSCTTLRPPTANELQAKLSPWRPCFSTPVRASTFATIC
jgi:hypothetical protein